MHVYFSRLSRNGTKPYTQTFDSESTVRGPDVVELTVSILSFWPISLWAENAIIFPSRHYCLFYFVIKVFKRKFSSGKKLLSAMFSLEAWGEPIGIEDSVLRAQK